jgi:calcineurin-like phosphoesterase family protein
MIYFTADTHFGHTNIIKHCNRPFKSGTQMDRALLAEINTVVGKDDTLYVLGDFAWRNADLYLQKIACDHVHLIIGNHDKHSECFETEQYWLYLRLTKLYLSHYPHVSWPMKSHHAIHLYGHTHGTIEDELDKIWPGRHSMDVGVDNVYRLFGRYRPISLNEVLTLF